MLPKAPYVLTIRRGSKARFMDCFFDAMFRTTGAERHPTTPTRNQLANERIIGGIRPTEAASATLRAAPGNSHAKALPAPHEA